MLVCACIRLCEWFFMNGIVFLLVYFLFDILCLLLGIARLIDRSSSAPVRSGRTTVAGTLPRLLPREHSNQPSQNFTVTVTLSPFITVSSSSFMAA